MNSKKQIIKKLKSDKTIYQKSIIMIVIILVITIGTIGLKKAFSSTFTTEVLKDQEVGDLIFKNAKNEGQKLIVDVEAKKTTNLSTIEVIYINENGEEITTLLGYIGNSIEEGEVKKLVVETDEDLSAVRSIEYKIK